MAKINFSEEEGFAKNIAEKVLDDFVYEGKTIREWAKIIMEQEPCEDAISRQAVLKLFATHDGKYLYEAIRDMPSVKQAPKTDSDYISRQAVLNTLEFADKFLDEDRTVERYKTILTEAYEVLPSANPQEPKTGRWIDREIYDADRWECSECGRTLLWREKYCPNCGAKMEREERYEN